MRTTLIFIAMLALSSCSGKKTSNTSTPNSTLQLFDGKSLNGWRTINFEIGGGAPATIGTDLSLNLAAGNPMAGIVIDHPNFPLPTGDYEIELEARIIDGNDIFCALTFPIPTQGTCCTLIIGGWGGTVVGISSINHTDASLNTTRHDRPFNPLQWYHIRTRITTDYLEVWIDHQQVIEFKIANNQLTMRPGEIEACQPIGLATWRTAASYKNLILTNL